MLLIRFITKQLCSLDSILQAAIAGSVRRPALRVPICVAFYAFLFISSALATLAARQRQAALVLISLSLRIVSLMAWNVMTTATEPHP